MVTTSTQSTMMPNLAEDKLPFQKEQHTWTFEDVLAAASQSAEDHLLFRKLG